MHGNIIEKTFEDCPSCGREGLHVYFAPPRGCTEDEWLEWEATLNTDEVDPDGMQCDTCGWTGAYTEE